MNSQSPETLSHMCNCEECGVHDVPDPIWPQKSRLVSLAPTLTAMSPPDITSSSPMSGELIPGMPSMPFIPPIAPGDGLAAGMGIFIFCSGEACGFGEADGICMPGMFICVCGDAEGDACGIRIPGMFCIC